MIKDYETKRLKKWLHNNQIGGDIPQLNKLALNKKRK